MAHELRSNENQNLMKKSQPSLRKLSDKTGENREIDDSKQPETRKSEDRSTPLNTPRSSKALLDRKSKSSDKSHKSPSSTQPKSSPKIGTSPDVIERTKSRKSAEQVAPKSVSPPTKLKSQSSLHAFTKVHKSSLGIIQKRKKSPDSPAKIHHELSYHEPGSPRRKGSVNLRTASDHEILGRPKKGKSSGTSSKSPMSPSESTKTWTPSTSVSVQSSSQSSVASPKSPTRIKKKKRLPSDSTLSPEEKPEVRVRKMKIKASKPEKEIDERETYSVVESLVVKQLTVPNDIIPIHVPKPIRFNAESPDYTKKHRERKQSVDETVRKPELPGRRHTADEGNRVKKKPVPDVKFVKFTSGPRPKPKKFDFKTIPEKKEATGSINSTASSPSFSGRSVSFSYPSTASLESVISLSEFRSHTKTQNIEPDLARALFKPDDVKSIKSFQVGYHPVYLVCPSCHNFIITKVTRRVGCTVYFVAIALCLIFPLCGIIPFLTTAVYDAHHWCPFCGAHIGVFKP